MVVVRCMTGQKESAHYQSVMQAQWSKRASVFAHSLWIMCCS